MNSSGTIVAQPAPLQSGQILVGGWFTTLGGQPRDHIARLNPDGSPDNTLILLAPTSWATGTTQPDVGIDVIAVCPPNAIVVGGRFNYLGGQTHTNIGRLINVGRIRFGGIIGWLGNTLVRLIPNIFSQPFIRRWFIVTSTVLDTSFNAAVHGEVCALAIEPNGGIIAGGEILDLNGQTHIGLGRLNPDGGTDAAFNPSLDSYPDSYILALALQPDGMILVGGSFSTIGGQTKRNLARLTPDGRLDPTFPEADGEVLALVLQPDGKILVSGGFLHIGAQTCYNGVARLNPDGTLDPTFIPDPTAGESVAVQPDGKILVVGLDTRPTYTNVTRLLPNGRTDASFTPAIISNAPNVFGTELNALAVQADGKLWVGGNFDTVCGQPHNNLARLNPDGTLDPSFSSGTDGMVNSLVIQP